VVRQAIDFKQRVCNDLAPSGRGVLPGGLGRFRLAALGDNVVVDGQCVLFYAMMLYLDPEMLCHERVGSWMVVNM